MEQIICKKCVCDKSDPDIIFDAHGHCNYCSQAQKALYEIYREKHNLNKWINRIKKDGKKYDCLIGLSGGVDSSIALVKLVKLGLKPLCFSVDNGWNKPEADENIMNLVEGLKVPFYRYTIDLKKFKELQGAFIKAGVENIEIPTDHILMAVSYELAKQYGIKWIISGGNVASESIMPPNWGYNARDLTHIKDIFKKMIGKRLTGLPVCGLLKWNIYKWWHGIKTFYLLDYLSYNRKKSEKILIREYGYKTCGGKHEENYFTWWFQNYYLFEKFGIDKRKPHYASLINSKQMTRKEAMDLLTDNPVYPRLGLEDKIWKYKRHNYNDYKTDEKLFNFISKIIKAIRKCKFTAIFKHQ